jgi:hypothetical protein
MASKKAKDDSASPEQLQVTVQPGETDARAMARVVLHPTVNNALTLKRVACRDVGEAGLTELVHELSAQCSAVSRGAMERPEALLTAQAHTLDALFNDLTRIAYRNWNNLDVAERLLRLAFKAQSQSRATVETLGNLRNPRTFIAQQANIAHGPQQVNNGEPSRTREIQSEQSKLLEQTHGERLDTGAAGQAIGGDPAMATVGAVHRPEDGSG